MPALTLIDALTLIRNGQATFDGTTHTDLFGFAAIITRHDLATTQHVADVGADEVAQLSAAGV